MMAASAKTHAATTHPSDFVDAHERHWEDGNLLCDHARWANAAYLFGYSAECGLKALMQATEWMSVDAEGVPESRYRKHIQHLWPAFENLARTLEDALYELPAGRPFRDWSHHNRYAERGHVSEATVDRYRDAAHEVVCIVQLAMTDGSL